MCFRSIVHRSLGEVGPRPTAGGGDHATTGGGEIVGRMQTVELPDPTELAQLLHVGTRAVGGRCDSSAGLQTITRRSVP